MKKLLTLTFLALGAGNVFAQSDYSSSATTISVNSSCVWTTGQTTNGATQSVAPVNCNGSTSSTALDVWYKFTAISSSGTIQVTGSLNYSPVIDLRNGAPGSSIAVACDPFGNQPVLNYSGLSVSTIYYIRIYHFGNNASDNFQICVTGSGGGGNPDLITQNFTMSPNPVNAGSSISISFDVKNQGTATASASTTRVRINQSSTNVLSTDPLIATFSTPSLSAGSSTTHSTNYTVPSSYSGTYYVWVILDVNNVSGQGANEIANDKTNYSLTVNSTGNSDLITQNFTMSPNPVSANGNLAISFNVKNQGNVTSNSCQTNVRINQSSSSVSGSDPLITSFTTPSLSVNGTTTHSYNYTVPSSYSGIYYVWVILDVNSTAGQGTANEANDKSNYQLQVTSCSSLSVSSSSTNATCNGQCNGTLSSSANGGTTPYTYSWNTGSGGTPNESNICAGTYTLTVTDANNCTVTSSATISQPVAFSATTNSGLSSCTSCTGFLSASPSGGVSPYSYQWSGSLGGGQAHSAVCPGNYSVTVTDANGCKANASATVSTASSPTIANVSTTNNTSCSNCNGAATVNYSGGTGPFTFSWSGTSCTTSSCNNLCNGTYSVTVTDFNNCTASGSGTVVSLGGPTIGNPSVTNASCGNSNGQICLTPSGGSAPYTYLWSNSQTGNCATGLSAGNYSVTVTDNNNCSATTSSSVSNTGAPTITASSTNATANGVCNGTASVTASGGTSPYSYLWSNGTTTANDTGLCAGTYSITVTGANNCQSVSSVTITQPLGISETNGDFHFTVFPNPNDGNFIIEFSDLPMQYAEVKVLNVLGEIVYLERMSNATRKEISLGRVSAGVYFIRVKIGEKILNKKIFVQ